MGNFPQAKLTEKTRDIAAKAAGFGCEKTYRQAKHVVNHGTPELVSAMDNGAISISAAATLATLPKDEQKAVVAMDENAIRDRIRSARETKQNDIIATANKIKQTRKMQAKAEREEEKTRAMDETPLASDRYQLIHGKMDLAMDLDPESVDFVITDPPYSKEFLPTYQTLGRVAAHVLKPGGLLIAMVGQFHLPEVIQALTQSLTYHWSIAYLTPGGQSPQIFPRKVNSFWKPVFCFANGEYTGPWFGDVVRSNVNDNDKEHHHWGQSESGMSDLMQRFVKPGTTVLDPCLGGGTTGVVALQLGCRFIGYDVDQQAIATTLHRFGKLEDAK